MSKPAVVDRLLLTATRSVLAQLSVVMLLLAPTNAHASLITIDFGGLLGPDESAVPDPYTEDGFTVSATSGVLEQDTDFGNPAPSLDFLSPVLFDITADDGGLFSLVSFDYATLFGAYFVLVNGYTNNVVSSAEVFVIASSGFTTQDSASDLLVDRLRFTILPLQGITFNLDNIVLETPADPVPEPASLTLLGLGLAGIAGRRWRQRKAS